jgi:hypothetical protein
MLFCVLFLNFLAFLVFDCHYLEAQRFKGPQDFGQEDFEQQQVGRGKCP